MNIDSLQFKKFKEISVSKIDEIYIITINSDFFDLHLAAKFSYIFNLMEEISAFLLVDLKKVNSFDSTAYATIFTFQRAAKYPHRNFELLVISENEILRLNLGSKGPKLFESIELALKYCKKH